MNPLNPFIEAQCFIAGCVLHRSGFDLASPIAIMLASDLAQPLSERRFLGGWGDEAGVWDVDITDADGLAQMMERAAPALAALHRGALLGPSRIAAHLRARIERGEMDFYGVFLLIQNCVPFMRDEKAVCARAKRAMHEMLDEIINEADAQVERFAGLAMDGPHATKRWSRYRLPGDAVAPVLEHRLFFLEIMKSLVPVLNDTVDRMRAAGVPSDVPAGQVRSKAPGTGGSAKTGKA
jgi:hypothetical protein